MNAAGAGISGRGILEAKIHRQGSRGYAYRWLVWLKYRVTKKTSEKYHWTGKFELDFIKGTECSSKGLFVGETSEG